MVTISKSITLDGPFRGLGGVLFCVSILIGIVSFGTERYIGFIYAISCFVIGYIGVFTIKCIEYNDKDNSLYIYKDYFIKKFGQKFLLDNYIAIQIQYKIGNPTEKKYGLVSTTLHQTQSKKFDVYLISNNEKLFIKQFIDVKKAKEFEVKLSEITGLEIKSPLRVKN